MLDRSVLKKIGFKMPTDSITMAVTAGLGFSVLAGIVSGVCYILTYGIPKKRHRKPQTPWHCSVCGHQFRSIDGILEIEKVVTCAKCKKRACKLKCAKREHTEEWICQMCRSDSWFSSLLNALQPSTTKGWYTKKKMNQTTIDEIDEDLMELQKKEREQVRDFIERLLEALLGGDLDSVSVKKLYNDPKYLPITGQSPCSAHATLKLLIQKLIEDAAGLPKMPKLPDHPASPDDTGDRTYEDLLATAVVNKVIQNYQEEVPSSAGSISSRASTSSRKNCDKEYFFGERNLEPKRRYDDTSSVSSMDDLRSEPYTSAPKYFDRSPLVSKQHTDVSSTEDDILDDEEFDTRSVRDNNWQENWHLRKRKLNGTSSPAPVPMFVPNSNVDAKVLIGDRVIEDTSDLSDAGSDFGDSVEPSSLNSHLVNSRTLIGGRNPIESIVAKAESISDDGSTDDSDLIKEKEDIVQQFTSLENTREEDIAQIANEVLLNQQNLQEPLETYDSNIEQDSEYTEKYATLPRTIVLPQALPRKAKIIDQSEHVLEYNNCDNVDSGVTSDEDDKHKNAEERFKNTIYERRCSNKSRPQVYGLLENEEFKQVNTPSLPSSTEIPTEALVDVSYVDDVKETPLESPIKPEEQSLFKAVPVIITDETDVESSIEPATPTRSNQLDLSSDSDSIERTYNIPSGQILKKGQATNDFLSFNTNPDVLKHPRDFDENHNTFVDEQINVPFITTNLNHFKLVDEIANETPEQYKEEPISPPADFKNLHPDSNCDNFQPIRRCVSENLLANNSCDISKEEVTQSVEDLSVEIDDLKKNQPVKKLVKSFSEIYPNLKSPGKFNESKPNLLNYEGNENEIEIQEKQEDGTSEIPSVNAMKSLFEKPNLTKPEVYSLTARSIPKKFRQELKKDNCTATAESDTLYKEETTSTEVPFPTAKSKIQYYENLIR
ncbi:PREDICTED: uncharacterized protein LOC108562986 isoform X2 [Nicrophorus vespilloides]|uniref:Uncharacterized protein LOC108562986 isoform X2 n=1 Tax=Nicrophorus vespilloides TaxID=110193 RepID=A0ABM1MQZ4_NICVS|nr:PREDICTED: uncharacterized protein LOC108562986 isoform X2 [Nicrophorus vespilloides]